MPSFQDQVVVVTGATSGIGRALARAFTAAGARVLGTGRDQARLAELAREIDVCLTCDVRLDADVALLRALVEDRFGRVDVLVNNAGVGLFGGWEATRPEDLQALLDVNLLGAVRVARALVPGMVARGAGTLVQVASIAGRRAFGGQAAYCASKHALIGWSDALRQELAGTGVAVCVVAPPAVDTPFFARAGLGAVPREWRPLDPVQVAVEILAAVAAGERERIVGTRARLIDVAARLAPCTVERARQRRQRKRGT